MLVFATPRKADAAIRFGVALGAPAYSYAGAYQYGSPYPYAAPYPYYNYPAPVYSYPYVAPGLSFGFGWGGGHRDRDDWGYREGGHRGGREFHEHHR
jgi:hypothetical protein